MPRTWLVAVCAALLLSPARAYASEGAEASAAALVVVEGLALDDLLNVRATASATGMVIGRLPNGSTLRQLECSEVNGNRWCRIAALDDEGLNGWTPGRYLHPKAGGAVVSDEPSGVRPVTGERDAPAGSPAVTDPIPAAVPEAPLDVPTNVSAEAEHAIPIPTPAPRKARTDDAPPAAAAPADLVARLEEPREEAADPRNRDGGTVGNAEVPAPILVTAFAQTVTPATGGVDAPKPRAEEPPAPAADPPAEIAGKASLDAAAASPERLSSVAEAAAEGPETGLSPAEIPCARYLGQPMTRCKADTAKTGEDSAEVTVILPDGGKRVIRFRGGRPEGSNSRGQFRFTREGDLSMIRIGTSERFEILDSFAAGD